MIFSYIYLPDNICRVTSEFLYCDSRHNHGDVNNHHEIHVISKKTGEFIRIAV